MEGQEDFIKEKSLLEIEITARGHKCIFYPKFYCELNYTEFFWGAVECYTRLDSVPSLQSDVLPTSLGAGWKPMSTALTTGSRPLLRDR